MFWYDYVQWNRILTTCGLTGAFGRFNVSSSSAITVANVIKYGMIAIMSIIFMTSLKKFILLGQARNLKFVMARNGKQ
jgi:hypothetical protein